MASARMSVRFQLPRTGHGRSELKTSAGRRTVVLLPSLVKTLAKHKLASERSAPEDFVFATSAGTPLSRDNVRSRVFRPAVDRALLDSPGTPRLRMHDLRHTFASMLIASGASPAFVAAQMGHGSPAVTLGIYTHLFEAREHGDKLAEVLEAHWGAALGPTFGHQAASSSPGC
jgi:integrase